MRLFSNKKEKDKKEKLILVLDIRSSSVGGAFFMMQKSGIPKIIYSVREDIVTKENLDIDNFLSITLKHLDIVLKKMQKSNMGVPESISCMLSSPWHFSQTRTISFEKNTPFIFTQKFAESLIEKERTLIEEEILNQYKDSDSPMRSIELKNIKTILNGYEVLNPLNKKAKQVEMNIFVSFSPLLVLNKIEETIQRYFNLEKINFSSFALSSFTLIRDVYIHKNEFIFVDIGGEITDMYIVKQNALTTSASFPLGINSIVRFLASFTKSTINEAKSALSLFMDGHLVLALQKKLHPILEDIKNKWLTNFQTSLDIISKDISLPSTIYLITEKEYEDMFAELIKKEEFNQYTKTESKFKIIPIGPSVLHDLASFDDKVIRDPFLIMSVVYINRFFR
jgi:hypothetical protein